MNKIIFEVYKNTLKKKDGFNPTSAENKYSEIKLNFKGDDDWGKCDLVTATFFGDSADDTYSVATKTNDMTATIKIPAEVLRNNNKIQLGVSGIYNNENNESVTVATNIAVVNINKGIIINDNVNANLYNNLLNLINNLQKSLSFITPQLFGAKGNGNHDDTFAVQAAINTGMPVYIPRGTYKVSKIIISGKKAKIWGDGVDSTIIKHDDTSRNDDCIIHINGSSNCTLSSLSVVGGSYSVIEKGYDGANYHGIMVTDCLEGAQNIIEDVDVYKCLGSGIRLKSSCIGCRVSNVHTYGNVECGFYNGGYGNKVVNLDTHQNRSDGIKIEAGGFNGTNIKSWGNRRDGVNIEASTNNVLCVVLTNISVQQNGRNGLTMNNCKSCVITGFQSLANNYMSKPRLVSGEQLETGTSGIFINDNNINNFVQGNVTSCYTYWGSFEESSVKITGKNNINNIVDVSVTNSISGSDLYKVCFLPIEYNGNEITNYTTKNEYKMFRQTYDNPTNIIKFNSIQINDNVMQDIKNSTATNTFKKKVDGTDYMIITDNAAQKPDVLTLNLSGYSDLTDEELKNEPWTIDNLKQNNTSSINMSNVACRRGYKLSVSNSSYDVMYLRLTAKVSEYKAFGIFPIVQILYKDDSNKNVYEYVDVSLEYGKTNVIFNTDYVTKNIALDISKFKGKNITVYPRLCITKLSLENILGEKIQDTATIDIKEFSYKFS